MSNRVVLDERHLTIAEILRDAGFQTAGFASSVPLISSSGFGQGFDYYRDTWGADEESKPPIYFAKRIQSAPASSRRGQYTTDDALGWFAGERDLARRAFAFIHYYDPHEPYIRPEVEQAPFERFSDRGKRRPDSQIGYDSEVAYTDRELRRLFAGLEAGGHLDDTLIVLWSDHGQGLLDHGWPGHNRQLYDEALHVPLIMIWPDRIPAGRDFTAPMELMDLVPTVLGSLKLSPKDAGFEGRDLSEAILGNAEPDREHSMFFQRSPMDV